MDRALPGNLKTASAQLLRTFDAEIDNQGLAGMAARTAIEILLVNWDDAGGLYPGDVDDVIRQLQQWKEKVPIDDGVS